MIEIKKSRMRIIPLPTQIFLKERLDYNPDTGIFIWKARSKELCGNALTFTIRWAGRIATRQLKNDYWSITFGRSSYLAHRLAWMYHYGEDPGNKLVDHKNGDRSDNRIVNLRLCTASENLCNRSNFPKRTNLYKGVYLDKRKNTYYYQITKNYEVIASRSGFISAELARDERNSIVRNFHGEFSSLS